MLSLCAGWQYGKSQVPARSLLLSGGAGQCTSSQHWLQNILLQSATTCLQQHNSFRALPSTYSYFWAVRLIGRVYIRSGGVDSTNKRGEDQVCGAGVQRGPRHGELRNIDASLEANHPNNCACKPADTALCIAAVYSCTVLLHITMGSFLIHPPATSTLVHHHQLDFPQVSLPVLCIHLWLIGELLVAWFHGHCWLSCLIHRECCDCAVSIEKPPGTRGRSQTAENQLLDCERPHGCEGQTVADCAKEPFARVQWWRLHRIEWGSCSYKNNWCELGDGHHASVNIQEANLSVNNTTAECCKLLVVDVMDTPPFVSEAICGYFCECKLNVGFSFQNYTRLLLQWHAIYFGVYARAGFRSLDASHEVKEEMHLIGCCFQAITTALDADSQLWLRNALLKLILWDPSSIMHKHKYGNATFGLNHWWLRHEVCQRTLLSNSHCCQLYCTVKQAPPISVLFIGF